MRYCLRARFLSGGILLTALLLSPMAKAQDDSSEAKGIDSGGYNIHQTIDFGYRANWITGNINTYDTFINLGQGWRLFDYSLDMRSLHHDGLLFDSLNFSGFGYGGDPNDVARLRIEKYKWYDFRMMFRRDKNFWDWNLFVNPLNPISTNPALSPTTPVANSPHGLDLVRRMQDYNLTLLPQSKIRIRLGYSRNRDEGPGFFTTDGGTISPFNENYSYTTNAYHAGVDFRMLPRTTLSYDQTLTYFKQDNIAADQNFPFQVINGGVTTPVDLGNIWASSGGEILPCAVSTTPPTAPSRTALQLRRPSIQTAMALSPIARLAVRGILCPRRSLDSNPTTSASSKPPARWPIARPTIKYLISMRR